MKRLMLTLPVAALLLSGCAVYDAGPVYPSGGYYAPPPVVYSAPSYYPRYVAPPVVFGSVYFGGGRGHGGRGHGDRGYGHRGGWR